jgi:hypothetical protein
MLVDISGLVPFKRSRRPVSGVDFPLKMNLESLIQKSFVCWEIPSGKLT